MEGLKAFDEKMLLWLQGAYLWLYDRTGVYVATVSVGLMLVTMACWGIDWVSLLCWVPMMVLILARYWAQMVGCKVYNASALSWRDCPFRMSAWVLMPIMVIVDLSSQGPIHALGAVLWLPLTQLGAILIRDREPPEPRRKLALELS